MTFIKNYNQYNYILENKEVLCNKRVLDLACHAGQSTALIKSCGAAHIYGIDIREDKINQAYNDQIAALDKVASLNQDIANIQKQRMTIADALTRGDISAAAMAVQEARAQQAAKNRRINTILSRE